MSDARLKAREAERRYRARKSADPAWRARRAAQSLASRRRNLEAVRERDRSRGRRRSQATRERIRIHERERYLTDTEYREMRKAISQRNNRSRRAYKHNAYVEDVQPIVVLERGDGACGICGGDVDPQDFHVDHIVPLSRGGEHSYANTQVSHPACNVRKNARLMEEMV